MHALLSPVASPIYLTSITCGPVAVGRWLDPPHAATDIALIKARRPATSRRCRGSSRDKRIGAVLILEQALVEAGVGGPLGVFRLAASPKCRKGRNAGITSSRMARVALVAIGSRPDCLETRCQQRKNTIPEIKVADSAARMR